MDLGVRTMKGYSRSPKTPELLEPHHLSYPGHLLRMSYTSAEMRSVYSTEPADWCVYGFKYSYLILIIWAHKECQLSVIKLT